MWPDLTSHFWSAVVMSYGLSGWSWCNQNWPDRTRAGQKRAENEADKQRSEFPPPPPLPRSYTRGQVHDRPDVREPLTFHRALWGPRVPQRAAVDRRWTLLQLFDWFHSSGAWFEVFPLRGRRKNQVAHSCFKFIHIIAAPWLTASMYAGATANVRSSPFSARRSAIKPVKVIRMSSRTTSSCSRRTTVMQGSEVVAFFSHCVDFCDHFDGGCTRAMLTLNAQLWSPRSWSGIQSTSVGQHKGMGESFKFGQVQLLDPFADEIKVLFSVQQ